MEDSVWKQGIEALRAEGRGEWFVGSQLQELLDPRVAEVFPGCRLFRMDSEFQTEAEGRIAIQRWFVLRPSDGQPYQLQRFDHVAALARRESVILDTEEHVSRFADFALDCHWVEASSEGWVVQGDEDERFIIRIDQEAHLVELVPA
jgi:hypothetical protein